MGEAVKKLMDLFFILEPDQGEAASTFALFNLYWIPLSYFFFLPFLTFFPIGPV